MPGSRYGDQDSPRKTIGGRVDKREANWKRSARAGLAEITGSAMSRGDDSREIQSAIAPAPRSGRSGSHPWSHLGIEQDVQGDSGSSRLQSVGGAGNPVKARTTQHDGGVARDQRGKQESADNPRHQSPGLGPAQPKGGNDPDRNGACSHYQGCRSRAKSSSDFVSGTNCHDSMGCWRQSHLSASHEAAGGHGGSVRR